MIEEQARIGSVHAETGIIVAKLNEIIRVVNELTNVRIKEAGEVLSHGDSQEEGNNVKAGKRVRQSK